MSVVTLTDDRDPSVIYSGSWVQVPGVNSEYNHTTTYSEVGGSTATFPFVGTSIAVYGTVVGNNNSKNEPVSLYSIDGRGTVAYKADQSSTTQYQQLFFQSALLSDTSHVLTVTYTGSDAYPVYIDYFMVGGATVPASSPSLATLFITTTTTGTTTSTPQSSPSSHSSSLPSSFSTLKGATLTASSFAASFGTSEPAPLSSSSPTTAAVPAQGKSNLKLSIIGPIIGGAIGALILICIILLYLRRKRREDHSDENKGAQPPISRQSVVPQPYTLINPYNISQPQQYSVKGQPFIGTGMAKEKMTTFYSTNLDGPVSAGASTSTPMTYVPTLATANDVPPLYRE